MEDDSPFALADVLRWARYARKRDRHGAERCKEEWFGKEREELEFSPANVVAIAAHSELDREMARTRECARQYLASVCRSCGRCDLGE